MKFSTLIETLGSTVVSHSLATDSRSDLEITGVSAVEDAAPGTISYVEGDKYSRCIATTAASALILPANQKLQTQASDRGIAWIACPNPRLAFAQTIALFYQPVQPVPGIHPTAVIDPTAKIGQAVSIGAHAVIQSGVKIGDRVAVHPNVVVYPDVQIGDRTILYANCVIQERTQIGADCVIHSGAVIGSEGFGFVPTDDGWFKIQQSGYVVLEDGVEVGCNSTIDRATVGETRIGRNTKIDNLVQIGHGTKVGKNCALASQVGVSGSVQVGDRVILGGQVGVANQANIGDGVQAGAKAGIHSNVEPGEIVMGSPFLPYRQFLKASAAYSRLPEIYQLFKRLQRKFGEELKDG